MANYATDSDLKDHIESIFDYGPSSFEKDLTKATADVLNKIKAEWWTKAVQSRNGIRETVDYGFLFPTLNTANLNTAALKSLTVYRAFSAYIFPKMTKFVEDDVFLRQAEFYADRFKEEWDVVKLLPLYDFDEDASFEDIERRGPMSRRIVRA